MTSDQAVQADSETLARLVAEFEDGTVSDLEAFAAELGVTPPDDRDGWSLVYQWGPNGEDLGLHWYQPADDPLASIEQ
jgi:hypothetical protein